MHDPGYMYFGAYLGRDGKLSDARERLIEVVESVKQEPLQAPELERARTALLNDFEKVQLDAAGLVRSLSEFIAIGDWRLFFLYRDRLRKVKLDEVQRAAERYLKPANRVLGEFVPVDRPERAEIPPTPDLQAALKDYKGGDSVRLGEAFDPSPQNIEKRVVKRRAAQRHQSRDAAEANARRPRGGHPHPALGRREEPDQPRDRVQLRRLDADARHAPAQPRAS